MLDQPQQLISIITGFQFILFALFLLLYPKPSRRSNIILALVLLSRAFCILILNIIPRISLSTFYPFSYLGCAFSYLFGPLLFFYTRSLTEANRTLKKRYLFHLLPAFLYLGLMSPWIRGWVSTKVHTGVVSTKQVETFGKIILEGSWQILIIIYILASFKLISGYRKQLRNRVSSPGKNNLSWLYFILGGFLLLRLVDCTNLIHWLSVGKESRGIDFILSLFLFAFANSLVFRGLRQPPLFSAKTEALKYGNSPLGVTEKQAYAERLSQEMNRNRPFLQPELTIEELSESTGIPLRHLSQVINEQLGKNFFDFINHYRVEEAKKRLAAIKKPSNILQISLDSGFNSKATFNRVFKKYTGMTPSGFQSRKYDKKNKNKSQLRN